MGMIKGYRWNYGGALVVKDGEEVEDMTQITTPGYPNLPAEVPLNYNDHISSIRVRRGCVLKTWENKDYEKNKRTFTQDQENLKKDTEENPDNFGDEMSSFKCYC